METPQYMQSRIWLEEPEPNNEFACRTAYCHGYDVYGDMLGSASWIDMLFLLFRGEAPSRPQAALLEVLAVGLANPGPRDASVHAAMCAGVGGSPAAATLTAALAVGAGGAGGAREVFRAAQAWATCNRDIGAWRRALSEPAHDAAEPIEVWPAAEHPPGFDPLGVSTTTPVRQLLARLSALAPD
jgi:citrate synthase